MATITAKNKAKSWELEKKQILNLKTAVWHNKLSQISGLQFQQAHGYPATILAAIHMSP